MRVLGVVPARGGSKGIPLKNVALVAGRPLLAWTLEAAAGSQLDRTVVSTDHPEIRRLAGEAPGVSAPFLRPRELARDETPGIEVLLHTVRWLETEESYTPDAVMLLQPTSPLRTSRHIDEAIRLFEDREADSLVSVVRVPHNMAPESVMRMSPDGWLEPLHPIDDRGLLRQQKPAYHARNGAAVYLVRRSLLLERETLFGDRLVGYEMPPEDSVDVDDGFDLEMCEWLLQRRRARGAE
jgi:CMP-N-acetylneuraminic acid synthetase